MAEAQRRTRTPHLHLKSDDTICDTGAGSARGTGEATHHKPAAASEEAATPQSCSENSNSLPVCLEQLCQHPFWLGGVATARPRKAAGKVLDPLRLTRHHAKGWCLSPLPCFQMIHHRFPRAQPPPQSAGSNFLSAHDTIHGF